MKTNISVSNFSSNTEYINFCFSSKIAVSLPGLWTKCGSKIFSHPCVRAVAVGDKICTGTECKEIKSSTSDKGGSQVNGKGTVPNTTPGTN